MGFLQRGFASGNRRGFRIWLTEYLGAFTWKMIAQLLGGGGRIADQTVSLIEIPPVLLGHGSYPDSIGIEQTVSPGVVLNTTLGGGGRVADQTAILFTEDVVLSLGSYP